jgi:adenylate kinase family enzyme
MNHPGQIGRRIHVMGNSSAGKSTLAHQLAELLDVPFVELDALNWLPGWVGLNDIDPGQLVKRMQEATAGDGWVVAGSYSSLSQHAFWERLQTVIWLDLPARVLVARMITRSWRRWRSRELLWGTNHETFWPQFAVWRQEESLLWWIVTQHARKRADMYRWMRDPGFAHVRFVRLGTPRDVRDFLAEFAHASQAVPT